MSKKLTKAQWQEHCEKQGVSFQGNDTVSMLVVSLAASLGIKSAKKSDDQLKSEILEALEGGAKSDKPKDKPKAKAKSQIDGLISSVYEIICIVKAEKKAVDGKNSIAKHTFLDNAEAHLVQVDSFLKLCKSMK